MKVIAFMELHQHEARGGSEDPSRTISTGTALPRADSIVGATILVSNEHIKRLHIRTL